MMPLDPAHITAIYDALGDMAKKSGLFGPVTDHEALNPPGKGLTCSVLLGPLEPAARASGLATTSARLEFTLRIQAPRSSQPQGQIDRDVLNAAVTLIAALSADFALTGVPDSLVRNVDIFGAYGPGLGFKPGWITQGETPYRMGDVTVPLILNDVFPQVA
jgi:hypothetical protein